MRKTLTCNDDLAEAARLKINTNDPAYVEEIIMERNGEISVTKKNKY